MTRPQAIILLATFVAILVFSVVATARAATEPRMPAVLRRIGVCETGLRWDWSQPDYATAFGIHRAAWSDYRRYVPGAPRRPEQATPAQQVAVALAIARRVGYSAWGCYRHEWVRG